MQNAMFRGWKITFFGYKQKRKGETYVFQKEFFKAG